MVIMFKEKKIGVMVLVLMMLAVIIGIPQPFIGYSVRAAFASEKPRFATREVLDTLYSSKRNSMTTARMMAMLYYLLTEQKRTFNINYGTKRVNPLPAKAEEMLNNANYFAAQQKYDEAFEVFQETYNLLTESLERMAEEKEK